MTLDKEIDRILEDRYKKILEPFLLDCMTKKQADAVKEFISLHLKQIAEKSLEVGRNSQIYVFNGQSYIKLSSIDQAISDYKKKKETYLI